MKEFKAVECFDKPSEIFNGLVKEGEIDCVTEMNDFERGFLCGLIKKHRPHKIVEVGVAEGGTSAVVLKCVQELELDCAVYSVDLCENLYRDPSLKTGFFLDLLREKDIIFHDHTLFTGHILPEVLDEIGSGIDFLILDTMHSMPGEILDFLAAFPYLTKDAVVVLHDVSLFQRPGAESAIATNVLFTAVTADKYSNLLELEESDYFPNIAAFQLNEDTPKYLTNVAASLTFRWAYLMDQVQLRLYGAAIEKLGSQCAKIFYRTASYYEKRMKGNTASIDWLKSYEWPEHKQILLYGKAQRGRAFLRACRKLDIPIHGFVVSDNHYTEKLVEGLPVYTYSAIPFSKEEVLLVCTTSAKEILELLHRSDYQVLEFSEEFWRGIS